MLVNIIIHPENEHQGPHLMVCRFTIMSKHKRELQLLKESRCYGSCVYAIRILNDPSPVEFLVFEFEY